MDEHEHDPLDDEAMAEAFANAALDQTRASVADTARMIAAYFKALTAEGLDGFVALQLTINYQTMIMQSIMSGEDE